MTRPFAPIATIAILVALAAVLLAATPALASPGKSRVYDDSSSSLAVEFDDVSDSSWYYLWINRDGATYHSKWYRRGDSNCDGSRCRIQADDSAEAGTYEAWVQTWNSSGSGPWSDGAEIEVGSGGGPVQWIDPLGFRGEPGVVLALGTLGSEASGLIARGSSGAIAKTVSVPGGERVRGLRVCYESETSAGFIDEARLERLEGTADTSTVLLRDRTNRAATQPSCFDTAIAAGSSGAAGLLQVKLELALGSRVAIRAVGLLLGSPPSVGGGGGNGGGGNGGGGAGGDERLRCKAEGTSDLSMDGRFEDRGAREKFDASFEAAPGLGFRAGDVLDVRVAGTRVGTMVLFVGLGGDIEGDLEFDTQIEAGDDSVPFPGNFPSVSAGTRVDVGPLGCSLAVD